MSKRRKKPRFLRLAASLLAATGLLGHGLAMLLVGLLAVPVAAAPQELYFGEICTPDGLVRLADRDSGDSGEHHDAPLASCPVCTAFAQSGLADLPTATTWAAPRCCSATQGLAQESAPRSSGASDTQPRAPPATA